MKFIQILLVVVAFANAANSTNADSDNCGLTLMKTRIESDDRKDNAALGEYPWVVEILFSKAQTLASHAALIRPNVAISVNAVFARFTPGWFWARAGLWSAGHIDASYPVQDRRVVKIVSHPEYDSRISRFKNSLALLILKAPFDMALNVNLICLEVSDVPRTDFHECISSNWAVMYSGGRRKTLSKTAMSVLNKEKCLEVIRRDPPEILELADEELCVLPEAETDMCNNFAGAPLFCHQTNVTDKYYLLGLANWGIKLDENRTCFNDSMPMGFIYVPDFLNWIHTELAKI